MTDAEILAHLEPERTFRCGQRAVRVFHEMLTGAIYMRSESSDEWQIVLNAERFCDYARRKVLQQGADAVDDSRVAAIVCAIYGDPERHGAKILGAN